MAVRRYDEFDESTAHGDPRAVEHADSATETAGSDDCRAEAAADDDESNEATGSGGSTRSVEDRDESAGHADPPRSAEEDIDVTHRRLRSALELALAVATEADRKGASFPAALKPMLGRTRLMGPELGRVRRALVADPAFRDTVAAAAADAALDELGCLWLQRPPGWRERAALLVELETERAERIDAERALGRERKRREAVESKLRKAKDHTSDVGERVAALEQRLSDLRAELAQRSAEIEEMREQLRAAKTAERHALDRQRAADERLADVSDKLETASDRVAELEQQRDDLLAARVRAESGAALSGPSLNELRDVVEQMRRLSGRLAEVVTPPTTKRTPLSIPGAVVGDPVATAEHLIRSSSRVVVDGYNVAKLVWPSLDIAEQRDRLVDLADNLARRFAATIVVVFDGSDVVGASATGRRLVRVMYSPAGVSADDVIRAEVARTPPGETVTVVTNDREIQRDVVRDGANVLASDAFAELGLG